MSNRAKYLISAFVVLCFYQSHAIGGEKSNQGSIDLQKMQPHAAQLDAQSHAYFGVSIKAIALLFACEPGTVFPNSDFFKAQRSVLNELADQSYVTVKASQDGSMFSVERTEKGERLIASFRK